MDNHNPIVSICCQVYNHESFLRDCFEGFVMQQTTFPIEILVHDDASTDNSADIIRDYTEKYPDLFNPIYQAENQYSKGIDVFSINVNRAKGKYIAICEGDDYWTDPLKLQKQVDFMENNPDFAICFHNVKVWKQKEGVMVDDFITKNVPSETDIFDIIKGNYIHTPSILFRRNDIVLRNQQRLGYSKIGDFPQWVLCAQYGKIKKLEDCMAIYRYGSGLWSANNRERKVLEILIVYKNLRSYFKNKKLLKIIRQIIFNLYGELSKIYFVQKKYFKSFKYLMRAFVHIRTLIDIKTWVKNYLLRK